MMTKIVHVQSVLPYEDTIALKEKTGETSVKEASPSFPFNVYSQTPPFPTIIGDIPPVLLAPRSDL
jgi:hypothetical protein